MANNLNIQQFKFPPFPLTYITKERAIVEEESASNLILVESEYHSARRVDQPPEPISVTKTCGDVDTWRIVGSHMTESTGETRINLTKFLNCEDKSLEDSNFLGSISLFLATAQSSEPVFLTYELDGSLISVPSHRGAFQPNPAIDVTVIVKSWRHDGVRASSIPFTWMAIGTKTFFIGI